MTRKLTMIGLMTLLACVAVLAQALDRTSWKLKTEKILEGTAPTVPLGTVMRIQKDTSGKILVMLDGPSAPAQSQSNIMMRHDVSPDGRTLTETVTGTDRENKIYRVVRMWQKQ